MSHKIRGPRLPWQSPHAGNESFLSIPRTGPLGPPDCESVRPTSPARPMGGAVGCRRRRVCLRRRRQLPAGDANCRRCNSIAAAWRSMFGWHFSKPILAATPARSISLPRPAIANGAPLSETKVKADLAARFSLARSQIHPRAVGNLHRVTICHELSDADQIIKSKPGGTDRRQKRAWRLTPSPPRPVQHGGRVSVPGPCLFEAAIAFAGLTPGATVHPSLKRK